MGTTFPLIADNSLQAEDADYYTKCQVCDKRGVPLYECQGNVAREDGTADKSLSVYVACEKCLKEGKIAHIDEYRTNPLVERFAENIEEQKSLLRQTPRIPMQMQGTDWPLCCGKLAEYTGFPSSLDELIRLQADAAPWDLGPVSETYYDARKEGEPESFNEVSFFRCVVCSRAYWNFQPS